MTQSDEKTCIVLIGDTGSGKSTLTNILSKKGGAKTANGDKSCTKSCTIYEVDSKTTLMDTPGFSDSDGLKDITIIKDMTTELGKAKSPKVKIVWCVEPSCRKKNSLQQQAKLINALGSSTWNSVIILCKQGKDPRDWQGARKSASIYGAEIKHCLGITNIDCLDERKQLQLKKRSLNLRLEDDLFFSHEINDKIFETLDKIPSFEAKLRKIYHHASTSHSHCGSLVKRYRNKCSGCSRTPESFIYSLRSISHHTWYCHTTGCNRKIKVGDTFYHCWPCCNRSSHSNDRFIIGCRGMTCESCVKSYYEWKYNCCGSSEGSSGCVMSCCHRNIYSTLTSKCGKITYEPYGLKE